MRISIVTVAFNASATLADTLESVARQTHVDVEHIVMDGGSRDATADVVRDHGRRLAVFVSERDLGLYDAMNKGAARATGDVIAFLNADDWYSAPDVLAKVAERFENGADYVYGDLDFIDQHPPFVLRRAWRDAPHHATDFFRTGWHPAHPVSFVRSARFREAGGFDLRWRLGADYAFMARCMRLPGLRLSHVPSVLVNMRLGGASTAGLSAVLENNRGCANALRELGVRYPWRTIALKLMRKVPQRLMRAHQAPLWRPWAATTTPVPSNHATEHGVNGSLRRPDGP